MNTNFQAGFAEIDWTPEPGLPLLGQMHQRIATHARDPLYACAAALRNGEETAVIVTVDVCVLDNEFVEGVQAEWAKQSGLAPGSLLIHATHTHVAPVSTGALMEPALPDVLRILQKAVLAAATEALGKLEDVEVFSASGHLDEMGWNRRVMYENGTSQMYGSSQTPGYIGPEGPRDGALPLIWTRNAEGEITGVITGFASHPNTMEAESFYSADLPGAARKYLRRALGENTGVLYLTGAAGNTAPSILYPHTETQPWRGSEGCEKSGLYLAGEAMKVIAATLEPMPEPALKLASAVAQVPIREWPQGDEPWNPKPNAWSGAATYYDACHEIWPERLKDYSPFPINLNVLRIGDAVICTNPAELFVEFGMEIRSESPARVTLISELTDGYCGYVPTAKAFSRGGYETWTAKSSQLALDAGDAIVSKTRDLLNEAFA